MSYTKPASGSQADVVRAKIRIRKNYIQMPLFGIKKTFGVLDKLQIFETESIFSVLVPRSLQKAITVISASKSFKMLSFAAVYINRTPDVNPTIYGVSDLVDS